MVAQKPPIEHCRLGGLAFDPEPLTGIFLEFASHVSLSAKLMSTQRYTRAHLHSRHQALELSKQHLPTSGRRRGCI